MKREGIEIAYMGGYYTEMGLFVRQASDAHASLTVIANDPLMTGEFRAIASGAASGSLFTFMQDLTKNARAADVIARLKNQTCLRKATRFTRMPPHKRGPRR